MNVDPVILKKLEERGKVVGFGCVEWQGHKSYKGYGLFRHNNKTVFAHRAAYESYICKIPEGLHVLHNCDNRCCINPEHLRLGTNADNIADKVQRCRAGKKLSKEDVVEIKQLLSLGSKQSDIAEIYGINRSNVSRIATGDRWSQVSQRGA